MRDYDAFMIRRRVAEIAEKMLNYEFSLRRQRLCVGFAER
jgi:hypothetical protein